MAQCKRRFWDDDEKVRIVAQTRLPGVSVSRVARRYDVNANLVFKWLRDPRFKATAAEDPAATFLPVEVVAAPPDGTGVSIGDVVVSLENRIGTAGA